MHAKWHNVMPCTNMNSCAIKTVIAALRYIVGNPWQTEPGQIIFYYCIKVSYIYQLTHI